MVTPLTEPRNRAYPKIELHVHFEGTMRAETILRLARRHGVELAAETPQELAALLQFQNFDDFIEALPRRHRRPAARGRLHGRSWSSTRARPPAMARSISKASSPPRRPVQRGVSWDAVFSGYCDGIEEARERHGVEVRLTPDITRSFSLEIAEETTRYAIAYRDRGVVGLGLGGYEAEFPPEPFARVFELAHDAGLDVRLATGVLGHVRVVSDQAGLGQSERRANVTGALAARPGAMLDAVRAASSRGDTVLLVDDVVTTGATLAECRRALAVAGVEVEAAVAVADTPLRGSMGSPRANTTIRHDSEQSRNWP